MSGLNAVQQRFLALVPDLAAELLRSEESARHLKGSSRGYYGSERVFQTLPDGIGWAEFGEREPHWPASLNAAQWPHRITWTQARAHRAAQPASIRDQLESAAAALFAEAQLHWEIQTAINPNWYWCATPEQISKLDAERARHMEALPPLEAAELAAVLAMLPLASDEPTDLIEWAERLQ